MLFLLIFPNLKFGEFSLIFIVMTGRMMQVKFTFMGQDIVKRSTDSIINRFFFSKPNLEKIWIDVFKRNHSFILFQRNMYKYKNKGSLVKNLQLIIDYRQESSEVTPQALKINALRF